MNKMSRFLIIIFFFFFAWYIGCPAKDLTIAIPPKIMNLSDLCFYYKTLRYKDYKYFMF